MAARTARRVTRFVHVTHPKTGEYVVLTPGDEVPSWASKLVTNPKAFAVDVQDSPPADTKETATDDGAGEDSAAKQAAKSENSDGGQLDEDKSSEGTVDETDDEDQGSGDEPPTFQP